jgi:hypothetical protein
MSCAKNSGSSRRLQCFRKGVGIGLRSKTRKRRLSYTERSTYCGNKPLDTQTYVRKGDNYKCLKKGISVGQTKKRVSKKTVSRKRSRRRSISRRRTISRRRSISRRRQRNDYALYGRINTSSRNDRPYRPFRHVDMRALPGRINTGYICPGNCNHEEEILNEYLRMERLYEAGLLDYLD